MVGNTRYQFLTWTYHLEIDFGSWFPHRVGPLWVDAWVLSPLKPQLFVVMKLVSVFFDIPHLLTQTRETEIISFLRDQEVPVTESTLVSSSLLQSSALVLDKRDRHRSACFGELISTNKRCKWKAYVNILWLCFDDPKGLCRYFISSSFHCLFMGYISFIP